MNSFWLARHVSSIFNIWLNKPDKFGKKFWLLVDTETKYLLNGFPYLGQDGQPANVVKKLCEPYYGGGYTVTMDNYFTSVYLARFLKDKNTTILGTIRKNRRELPNEIAENMPLHSTKAYKESDSGATLAVYQCKRNKNVVLLSTLHQDVSVATLKILSKSQIVFYRTIA